MAYDIRGILSEKASPGVPPLFESEDVAVRALAHQLKVIHGIAGTPSEISQIARQIVRNVAAMVLEDWIE